MYGPSRFVWGGYELRELVICKKSVISMSTGYLLRTANFLYNVQGMEATERTICLRKILSVTNTQNKIQSLSLSQQKGSLKCSFFSLQFLQHSTRCKLSFKKKIKVFCFSAVKIQRLHTEYKMQKCSSCIIAIKEIYN